MKKMYVLDTTGKKLFVGTRAACKTFIKNSGIRKKIKLTERFIEKIVVFEEESNNDNNLAKPATKEGFFNRIFNSHD